MDVCKRAFQPVTYKVYNPTIKLVKVKNDLLAILPSRKLWFFERHTNVVIPRASICHLCAHSVWDIHTNMTHENNSEDHDL